MGSVGSTMKTYHIFLCTICIGIQFCADAHKLEKWQHPELAGTKADGAEESASRQPKIFFGTTTTSTTTLSTTTVCYVEKGVTKACSKKKRAAIENKPIDEENNSELIIPSSPSSSRVPRDTEEKSLPLSKLDELNQITANEKKIEPRFFLFYWYTSTITATATSYTSSVTFTITSCSAAGTFAYSKCG